MENINEVNTRTKENVQGYIDLYEKLKKVAAAEGNDLLTTIRAAEFLIADCMSQVEVGDGVMKEALESMSKDVENFIKAFKA